MHATGERGARPGIGTGIPLTLSGPTQMAGAAARSYLPKITLEWVSRSPDDLHQSVDGTLVFADVSGFTKLSERLARKGRVGAEELSDLIGRCFTHLLADAYANGGSLLKFGGDALLLLFSGPGHAARACRAAAGMRRALREIGRIPTTGGAITLRMSVGVHTDRFDFYLVGESHRELIVTGPGASRVVDMEATAEAGQIVVSPETAAALNSSAIGAPAGAGYLLRRTPAGLTGSLDGTAATIESGQLEMCLPRAVRDRLNSTLDDASHRRATVAFLHFDGIDELTRGEGPAVVAGRLSKLMAIIQAVVDRYDVTLLATDVDRDGGKVILVAGAPSSSENDEERMLLAVREIVDSDLPLPLRVGVNAGHVFAGDVGPPYRRTYTTMGDTVNLTARLMAKAGPGEILVTESVLRQSRTKFAVTELEPFMVKGKSHPVTAFVLGATESIEDSAVDDHTLLIGRDRELKEMTVLLDEARNRTGHLLELVGEAGIGKSRLVTELRRMAAGLTVRSVLCEQFEASTPYFVFRHVLNGLLGIPAHVEPLDAGAQLLTSIRTCAPDLQPWAPLLATVIGGEVPSTQEVRDLDPKFRRERLARTTVQLIRAVTVIPTLLVIEDAHWMDEPSSELLANLAQHVAEMPLLICSTRRDTQTGFRASADKHVTTMRPAPLDADVASTLVEAMTDEAPLAPHDVAALVKRAGGNPLFLRELIAAARTAASIGDLPDTVEAVIGARIDQLPADDRGLLRRLSVLGATFELKLASEVLRTDIATNSPTWRRLTGFLVSEVPGVARFTHALIRDTAYGALPYRVRQQLHAQVADSIEQTLGADPGDQAGVLSLHFFHARSYDKAWHYSRMAAERAQAMYANVEAAEYYERAITAARRTHSVPTEALLEVHELLGDVRRRLGNYFGAIDAYKSARRLVGADHVAEARLLLKTGRIREVAGRYADALRWLDRAEKALGADSRSKSNAQRAQVAVAFAAVRYAQGKPRDVIRWAEQAIADATRSDDRDALAHAYYLLDAAYVALGDLRSATHSPQALALYEGLGDLWGQGQVLNNLGCYAYWRGDWDEALRLYERGRGARERTGDAVDAAYGTLNIAEILSDQGKLDEAEPLLIQALRVWRAANDRVGLINGLAHLGRVMSRAGRYTDALDTLEEARGLAREVGRYADAVELGGRIAECHLFAGNPHAAVNAVGDAIDLMASVAGAAVHAPLLHRICGFALINLGRFDAGVAAFETSLIAARQRGAEFEIALTLRPLSVIAGYRGDNGRALRHESDTILARLGVVRVFEPSLDLPQSNVGAIVPEQSSGVRPASLETSS